MDLISLITAISVFVAFKYLEYQNSFLRFPIGLMSLHFRFFNQNTSDF